MTAPSTLSRPAAAARAGTEGTDPSRLDGRRLLLLAAALGLGALPAVLFGDTFRRLAALSPGVEGATWLGAGHAGLVWVAAPLATLGALVLLLAPGLLLALAADRAATVEDWILHGFALSLVVVSAPAAVVQAAAGTPLTGAAFAAVTAFTAALAGLALLLRLRRGRRPRWPLAAPSALPALAAMAAVPALLLLALAPKFHWESFNGDGAHAFESARLLLFQAVPFWDPAAGEIAGFPGTTSFLFAYPASWFVRLFGEVEAAARLPLLLFLPPLVAGIVLLANHARAALRAAETWLVWLAVVVYVVVISFSATYSPYSADIALPATQDTLLVAAFLGFVLSYVRRAWGWAAAFALLTCFALPNGLLLLGFWLVADALVRRPRPWRDLAIGGAIVAGAVAVLALLPALIRAAGLPAPGGEYGGGGIFVRFAFLQITDWTRLAYLVVPCGILPALALVLWHRQDDLARAVTLVTAAAFLFAFVQVHAPLHYYIPAMLLPLVVFWRLGPAQGARRSVVLAATAAAAAVALLVSWPADPGPFLAPRTVGAAIEDRVGGYDRLDPDQLRASTLLRHLIPYDWDPAVPHASLGGSPLVFNHYAHRRRSGETAAYVLQRADAPAPAGARLAAAEDGFALYVRDDAVLRAHRALRPPTPAGAAIYQEPRGVLFRSVPLDGGPRIIDLPAIAERLGVDVDALAARLGVER